MTSYNYKVLVTAPPILPKLNNYRKLFEEKSIELITPDNIIESLSSKDLIPIISDIDGILCGDDEIDEKVILAAKKLKVISKWGTGIDSIDSDFAMKKGIKVCRVKDIFSEPVTDSVLAYILIFCRKIFEKDSIVRDNKWEKVESFTLKEKTIGIIGLGHIGYTLAKKTSYLGMKVYGYDTKNLSNEYHENIKIVDLDTLLQESDFISLHCDLNESSYHLISYDQFYKMKKDCIIINTSRGQVIHQEALELALRKKIISGAALDVFEDEPLEKNSSLRDFKNVFLSPHNSNGSVDTFNKVDRASIQNIFNALNIK